MSETEVTSSDKNVSNDEESANVSEDKKPKSKRSLNKSKNDVTDDDENVETSSAAKSKRKAAPKGKSNKEKYSKFSIEGEKRKIPLLDQPAIIEGSRNRKTFVGFESKVTVTKYSPIVIPDGKGVSLGTIPLINSRLKRLRQNVLKELHRTIFGKCGNPDNFTLNLQKFHGFPFKNNSDEYKRKLRLFNKFHMVDVKELLFLLDLDMKVKKKEDASKQVLDFLLSPEVTENTQNVQSFGHPKRKATKRNYLEADIDDVDIKRKKKAKAVVKVSKEEDESDERIQQGHTKKIKSKAAKSTELTADDDDDDSHKEEEQESDDNNELKKPAKKRKRNQVIEEHEDSTKVMKSKKSTITKSNDSNKRSSAGIKSSKNEKNSTSELTDDELKTFLKKVLSDANLEETTMKTVYGLISTHYPNYNFSKKKDFIKDVVKSSQRNVQQMDVSNLSLKKLTDEDNVFLEYVMIDIRSYLNVLSTSPEKKKVLLFPPVNNFRRFLVHQLVEKAFRDDNLTTLSVGSLYARRTVVFPAVLKLMEKNAIRTNTSPKIVMKTVNPFEGKTSLDTTSKSMASSARHRTKKPRKPDLQIYVPRGRRLLETEKCKNDDENMLNTDESFVDCASDPSDQSTKRICDEASEISNAEKCKIDNSVSDEIMNRDPSITVQLDQSTPEILDKLLKDDDQSMSENNPGLRNTFDSTLYVTSQVKGNDEIVNSVLNENIRESGRSVTNPVANTIEIGINDESALVWDTVAESVEKYDIAVKSVDCVSTNAIVSHSDDCAEPVAVEKTKSGRRRGNVEENLSEESSPKNTDIVDVPAASSNAISSPSVAASSSNSVDSSSANKISLDKITKSTETKSNSSVDLADCDWEELFDDAGDFVHESLIEQLMTAIGKVSVQRASQDYRPFQTAEERSSDGECIIEIHGFTPDLKTEDLFTIFAPYRVDRGFQIVWVDDTHALAIFSSPLIADEVLNTELPFVKTRPLKNAIPKSRMIARGHVVPQTTRPKTCVSLARRLVSGHLGMKINVTDKQREAEKKLLSDARAQKRLVAKQKLDAWEGTGNGESP